MYIERKLMPVVESRLFRHKAIIILGARQVGKSTLMDNVVRKLDGPVLALNCDDPDVRALLTDINSAMLRMLVGRSKVIAIDEAQRVDNIGLVLKRIVDEYQDVNPLQEQILFAASG